MGLYNKEFDWALFLILGRELLNPWHFQERKKYLLLTVGPKTTPEVYAKVMTQDVGLSSFKDQACD